MVREEKHSIIRLKPKVSPAKILDGFPWVYDNELIQIEELSNLHLARL